MAEFKSPWEANSKVGVQNQPSADDPLKGRYGKVAPLDNRIRANQGDLPNAVATSSESYYSEDVLAPIPLGTIRRSDFIAAIHKNQRNTVFLCFFMVILLGLLGYTIGAFWEMQETSVFDPLNSFVAREFAIFTVIASTVWVLISLNFGDRMILGLMGAKKAHLNTYAILHNVVSEISIAAGINKPEVYVMQTSALNAFATGTSPKNAAITVTTGLLDKLSREELQGVVAHEIGHIVNYDIRYSMVVAIVAGIIAVLCDFMLRSLRFGLMARSDDKDDAKAKGFFLIFYIFFAIIAPVIAFLLQMAVSREREYMADATSVKLTRNPIGLVKALQKIESSTMPLDVPSHAIAHLFISNPYKNFTDHSSALFSTHPPIKKRIERLTNLH